MTLGHLKPVKYWQFLITSFVRHRITFKLNFTWKPNKGVDVHYIKRVFPVQNGCGLEKYSFNSACSPLSLLNNGLVSLTYFRPWCNGHLPAAWNIASKLQVNSASVNRSLRYLCTLKRPFQHHNVLNSNQDNFT